MDLSGLPLPPNVTVDLATTILNSAREGIALLDRDLRVHAANDAFFALFDLEEGELPSSLGALGVTESELEELRLLMPEEVIVGEHLEIEVSRRFPRLGLRHLHVSIRGIEVQAGDTPLMLIGVLDVTEYRRTESELQELRRDLEERVRRRTAQLAAANDELEAFSYSVSHDLRAPLRALGGFSAALVEDFGDSLDDRGKLYISHIQVAAEQMSQLIDDLLRLSRITRAEMQYDSLDLSEVARHILSKFRDADPAREIELDVQDGMVVNGDRALLSSAIGNLLENAWKYTRNADRPRIEFAASMENSVRIFRVRDNGAGFDMAYANKLFQPFERLHTMHEFEGNGIGLATVQRIIARHGGRLWAEGEPGAGATFYFTLRDFPADLPT